MVDNNTLVRLQVEPYLAPRLVRLDSSRGGREVANSNLARRFRDAQQ